MRVRAGEGCKILVKSLSSRMGQEKEEEEEERDALGDADSADPSLL